MALGDKPAIDGFGKVEQNPKGSSGESQSQMAEAVSFLKTLVLFVCLAFFLRASVVEAFKIPSGSMIPTLRIGDHILVSKLAYGFRLPLVAKTLFQFSQPRRGDVVVFTLPDEPNTPEDESGINIIKRVVGLPGDTIEVKGTSVYINNVMYNESYARWDEGGSKSGEFGPETVPEGHVLLLGDNRDHSRDSRFWSIPFLEQKRIEGRALIIYWSWDDLFSRIGQIIR